MGAEAEVFVFDHERYLREVVPAVRTYLRTGETDDWLTALVAKSTTPEEASPQRDYGGTYLFRDCHFLRSDLSIVKIPALREAVGEGSARAWERDWSERACRSAICRSRRVCPFHLGCRRPHAIDHLTELVTGAVVARCLGRAPSTARRLDVGHFDEVFEASRGAEGAPLRQLLVALATRGFVVGYRTGNSTIRGWLDPREARELARCVDELERRPSSEPGPRREAPSSPYRVHADPPPELPGLSLLRSIATAAAQDDMGILWGNDLG